MKRSMSASNSLDLRGSQAIGDGGKSLPSNKNYIKLYDFNSSSLILTLSLARLPACVANDL